MNGNPYQPPLTGNSLASYDNSLFWRVMRVCGVLLLWFLVMDAIIIVTSFRHSPGQVAHTSTVDIVKGFFLDWKL